MYIYMCVSVYIHVCMYISRLALNKEGVLYEDKLVQIGLKTALTGCEPFRKPQTYIYLSIYLYIYI